MKYVSEVFEYLVKNRHDIADIEQSLMMVLSSPNYVDANFFSKGLIQSVMENSSPAEQVKFFYFMEKSNLIWPYIQIYHEQFRNSLLSEYREYKRLTMQDHIKCFNISNKLVDYKVPTINTNMRKLHSYQKDLVTKIIKQNTYLSTQ